MTPSNTLCIAAVSLAFLVLVFAVGAAVVAIVRDMNEPPQDDGEDAQ